MKKNASYLIFLLGMPGCGKTTIGKALAKKLGSAFIDLDEEIISHEQQAIAEIFSQKGEAHFREIEAKLLRQIIKNTKQTVIAVGGGTPVWFDNVSIMNAAGVTVYLELPVNALADRLFADTKIRPLLNVTGKEELRVILTDLFKQREVFYLKADIKLVNTASKEQTSRQLYQQLLLGLN